MELERSTMARRIATLLRGEFAASTGRQAPVQAPPPDPVAALRERVGDALEQVVRLPDGRLVGVVRGEAPAAASEGTILLAARAAEALHPLGSASPLAGAEVLYRAPGAEPANPTLAARRDLVALAERKKAGGGALLAAGQPAESLGLFRDAMALACRALDPRGDPGSEPAALLAAIHGHLVSAGLLTEAEAGALARAGEAARAFAAVTIAPPDSLVRAIAADAGALVVRARIALAEA